MALQAEIDGRKTVGARRSMGQFATPYELARGIVAESTSYLPTGRIRLLEPSMGTGAFVSAARDVFGRRVKATGIELDADFLGAARELWSQKGVEVVDGDFTRIEPREEFDFVAANPPYVRHHALPPLEKKRLQRRVAERLGVKLSGLAGLYCHFLLFSLEWMRPGAVGAWLIPSEWMRVNYGAAIRAFLLRRVALLRVHVFDSSDVRFGDALVSSCVVWFRKGVPTGDTVRFTFGTDIERPSHEERLSVPLLAEASKWPPTDSAPAARRSRLGEHFDIRRGVVTGDNGFFVLSEDAARARRIPRKYLRPILPSPRHVKVDHVEADADGLPVNAERRYLLDCTGYAMAELPDAVRSYLESGLGTTARKNLCASRPVWYGQERRLPAHILCSYMGRGTKGGAPVRFILNDSDAIANNSFLMLYPKGRLAAELGADPRMWREIWRLLAGIPGDAIRSAGRTYGGGLQKVEPSELGNVPCPALDDFVRFRGASPREEGVGGLPFRIGA